MEGAAVGVNNGYGSGSGSGSGSGYGDGFGDGSGYGYGVYLSGEVDVPATAPWPAVHFVVMRQGGLRLRDGRIVSMGEAISHDGDLKLCQSGLHASFTIEEARRYAPDGSVPTKVEVWGRVIIGGDKLVAEHRRHVCVIEE